MGVERRQAEKTSFIFGRENENTGSPITRYESEIVKRRYVVTAWSHDENSEKEQSDRFAPVVRMSSVKMDFYGGWGHRDRDPV